MMARSMLIVVVLSLSSGCRDGETAEPCDLVTCSGHGECVDDGQVVSCACDEGYVADGFQCVRPCSCDSGTCYQPTRECVPDSWSIISAGEFAMGSPRDEAGRDDDEPVHSVSLTHDFVIATTEVDQQTWGDVTGWELPILYGLDRPIHSVTWHQAAYFCNLLSDDESLDPCYECDDEAGLTCQLAEAWTSVYECPGYRLPTEAEWEYAARAGTETATYIGDLEGDYLECTDLILNIDEIAWYCNNASSPLEDSVGSLEPNAWGLHDMLGGVYEWCHDVYDSDLTTMAVTDPEGPSSGNLRTIRGGSWDHDAQAARAASRDGAAPETVSAAIGLRPVRTLNPEGGE